MQTDKLHIRYRYNNNVGAIVVQVIFFSVLSGNRSRLWLLLNFWFRSGDSTFNRRYLHMWLYKTVCQHAASLYLKVIRAFFVAQSAFGNCIRFFSAIVPQPKF